MRTAWHSPTDVSDEPWAIRRRLRPTPNWRPGGPGRQPLARRRVRHGLFAVNTTGCPWRRRPRECGKGHPLSGSCRRWRRAGV
jgi:transposase